MTMNLNDWIVLLSGVGYVIAYVLIAVLGALHVKNAKEKQRVDLATKYAKAYVSYYDKQDLSNENKIESVVNDMSRALTAKGFKVTPQDLKNFEAIAETAVTALRLAQKKAEQTTQTVVNVPATATIDDPDAVNTRPEDDTLMPAEQATPEEASED